MKQSKKDCILNAACKIFAHFGFKKTSVNEIAESAGVAKGTVYLACESKEDLFYQVLNREVRDWVNDTSKNIDPRLPADQQLVPVLTSGLEQFEKRPLVRDLMSGKVHDSMPGWETRLDELRLLARSSILELLKMGVKQKVFRPELDSDEVALSIQDMQIGAYVFSSGSAGSADSKNKLHQRIERGLGLLLNGLRTPAQSSHQT